MKHSFVALIVLLSFAPLAFAATDCAKNCCQTYNGQWDYTYDNCFQPKAGYDTCTSQCEAAAMAAGPHGPGKASPENTYNCKVGFILVSVLGAAFVAWKA
jgi:hypothetical protein